MCEIRKKIGEMCKIHIGIITSQIFSSECNNIKFRRYDKINIESLDMDSNEINSCESGLSVFAQNGNNAMTMIHGYHNCCCLMTLFSNEMG